VPANFTGNGSGEMIGAANSIEENLLLDCASAEPDPARLERIQNAVATGIDWKRLLDLAERHRLTPLVCRSLEDACPEALDNPGVQVLRSRKRRIAQRNLQLTGEMLALVKVLDNHGIPSVPLKGPVLAVTAFGNLFSRMFDDIDLLVRPENLDQACEILLAAGYEPEFQLTPRQRAAYIGVQHAFSFFRRRDGITVELHWRLCDRYLSFPLKDRDLWANVQFENLFGTRLRCLKLEHNLLFLCMHGAKHFWNRVDWISSLNALARSQPSNRVPLLIAEAERLRSTRLLRLGVTLAHQLSPCPGTQRFLEAMPRDTMADGMAAAVWRQMFAEEPSGWNKEVYRLRFYMEAREHVWDRVRLVWIATVRIPPPQSSEWNNPQVPGSLLFLYYFLRPIQVFRKVGLRGLRSVLRA